ncbi:mitochondrial MICOS protein Mic19 [Andalucia godoyi]|uniref:Mitochondrial MICOS protein Mic19 n=1 Tax=Andalucia godoyi TaxID=505711 RepID=A0A8K0AIF4_ANDGO|nr:mitochondrial MICOS protein Mic19 [Andalucia godoyi]|eukprot:ANDGO_02477.mRNA.1 mitochondrial MICOS protein Mic19
MGNAQTRSTSVPITVSEAPVDLSKGHFSVRVSEELFGTDAPGSHIPPSEKALLEEGFKLGVNAMQSWKLREMDKLSLFAERQRASLQKELEDSRVTSTSERLDSLERAHRRSLRKKDEQCEVERQDVLACYRMNGIDDPLKCTKAVEDLKTCADRARHAFVESS